ncbi:MAG: transcriptional repressor [Muribaculaceae bacterium]|nr:transcriptional repressor [Muribaculaceae bacterium]
MNYSEEILTKKGVRCTPNRLLVLQAIINSRSAVSLTELDELLPTIDRSSIFRTLVTLVEHDILHSLEDGEGIMRYEACSNPDDCSMNDMHIHFYCRKCHRTFCFPTEKIPTAVYPDGFHVDSVNYMAKGLCPECSHK